MPPLAYAATSDGVSVAWQRIGSGPALVWMPSLGNLVAQWRIPFLRRAYEALAESMTLVLYDGRGTGGSDRRVDLEDLGVQAQLRDLDAVVAAAGLDAYGLLGYYHSVPAAIAHAAAHPEAVTRLILFGGSARMRDVMSPGQTQALLSLVEQDWDLFADSAAQAWLGWDAGEDGRRLADSFRAAASPALVRAMFAQATRTDVTADLPRVKAPALVVHRQSDRQLPVEVSAALAAALPRGVLAQPPGSRPALFLDDPGGDLDLIRTFVVEGRVVDAPSPARVDAAVPAAQVVRSAPDGLTPRELEILRCLTSGATNARIARELGISEHTVERHLANVYRKVGARGRAEASAYAVRRGLG